MDKFTQRLLDEWLEKKLKEQEEPLVKAPGSVIAKQYRGRQIVRWFFLNERLEDKARTSLLHGPRKASAGILGAAPLTLAYPLVAELEKSFPAYTFHIHISPWGEDIFNENYEPTLNDISISYRPTPARADHVAIYDKAVSMLLELGEQQSK